MTYEDIAERIGQPKSTLWSWFNGDGEPSTEAILTLLEWLPYTTRHQVLDSSGILRARPSLEHPRLAHNPTTVSHLRTLLLQEEGITVVRGERDDLVTFVIVALGHSFRYMAGKPRDICGIDSHSPDWFVPVPGIKFTQNVTAPDKLREALKQAWPTLSSSEDSMVIINGFPLVEIEDKLLPLARDRHVILGEKVRQKETPALPRGISALHLIHVAPERANQDRISIEVQSLRD